LAIFFLLVVNTTNMQGCVWKITTQDEINSFQSEIEKDWLSCHRKTKINIIGATGTLNFTALSHLTSISVSDSPELTLLSFPQLVFLEWLDISDATSLTTLSIPQLSLGHVVFHAYNAYSGTTPLLNLNITNAPALTTIDLKTSHYLGHVNLFGIYNEFKIFNAMTIFSINTDSCVDFSQIEIIRDIHFYEPPEFLPGYMCSILLYKLTSIGKLTMDNSPSAYSSFSTSRSSSRIQVNDSVILANANDRGYTTHYEFDRIQTIHNDLNITSFQNLRVGFDGLAQVGATISLFNNTNCTFTFGQMSSVNDLIMVDNMDTILPLFPKLQYVRNIHMRGNIDT
jgi:hypothetical protein